MSGPPPAAPAFSDPALSVPALSVPALSVYVKLHRAVASIDAQLAPRIAAAGLTPTQFGVLEALLHKGTLTQAALGRKVLSSPGNMTDVIDKLAARGLVRRGRAPGDRRAVRVSLTEAGQALIGGLFPDHAAAMARAMRALSASELETLGGLLRRLGLGAADALLPRAPGVAGDEGRDHLPG